MTSATITMSRTEAIKAVAYRQADCMVIGGPHKDPSESAGCNAFDLDGAATCTLNADTASIAEGGASRTNTREGWRARPPIEGIDAQEWPDNCLPFLAHRRGKG